MVSQKLFTRLISQFLLPRDSIHGLSHWKRVEAIGNHLAASTRADLEVVALFAYLHDSCRLNEEFDPQHGERASILAKDLFNQRIIKLSQAQVNDLVIACKYHSQKKVGPENVTIATCWDADRLDLWRLGIVPDPDYLYSNLAKSVDKQKLDQWTH